MATEAVSPIARAPWWRRGIRNGLLLGALVLLAALALNHDDLPALRRMLAEAPFGIALSLGVHIPQIVITALAWRSLLPPAERPPIPAMARLRWFRESANALLPAGALVGQAAAARLLARRGIAGDRAGATATVDLTLEAVSQLFFTLAGVALLLGGGEGEGLLRFALAGFGIALGGAAAMVLLQRRLPLTLLERGLARLARRWPAIQPGAIRDFQAAILALHADWPRLVTACLWHSLAWVLGAVEVAGLLWLMGHDVTLAEALVIESLAQALRNAGFMLPGALAVQEGAIIGAAALVGVPPGAALAVALTRRAREVVLSLPGLLAWQRAEIRATATADQPAARTPL
ncbi:lysylphosphatidylglycerol synthase domain-containing protein [Siccirubricoccus sp. KC 17139]|uniref:Lysylphosphatidylglycerol synthase domain-containing protein n=1 Tax=Siccirubricoccus soli TaxID=2899147 RepID=A0ABT1D1G2_9PROT|nr:lysylphosphatidylglycerol synthase domain-containing protein [Siccirubricoccus soli]MCO6415741.1 lysylphosphatidylglycerol synthase domain-containing protein [Siccirubricoccus soli]MCP2681873.1 lysylphosphatidylglycerol synthase domain-containing protein [Siccirubricoccus soli]